MIMNTMIILKKFFTISIANVKTWAAGDNLLLKVLTLLLCVSVYGCGMFRGSILESTPAPTLAELPAARDHLKALRQGADENDQLTHEAMLQEVSKAYHEALVLAKEPAVRQEIHQRLAHIDLQIAEERQINDAMANPKAIYSSAITAYLALLDSHSISSTLAPSQDLDKILYPLAKAYEMSGDIPAALAVFDRLVSEVSDSRYYSEAQFRRAEILFADGDYAASSNAYRSVIQRADEQAEQPAPFLMNSWYMAGWSDFKLGRYSSALKAFFVVMDKQSELGAFIDTQAFAKTNADANSDSDADKPLAKQSSQQALTDDTLRVMSLAFSYESGSQSIADLLDELYQPISEPVYVDRLYSDLAGLYLEKKRYADSAQSYAAYINRYPDSAQAPSFHVQMIDVYVQGGFPEKVREEKQSYVASYGVRSQYWAAADSAQKQAIQQDLNTYISELAGYYHNLAQSQSALFAKQSGESANANKSSDKTLRVTATEVRGLFRQAGDWYEEWIVSLPMSPDLDKVWFLLGETRFESQDFADAIAAYENAAYGGFGDLSEDSQAVVDTQADIQSEKFDQHNEAGYAALISYDRLIALLVDNVQTTIMDNAQDSSIDNVDDDANGKSKLDWQNEKNQSALLFAQTFPSDSRSIAVLAQTTESLLALGQFDKTIEVGKDLLTRLDNPLDEINAGDIQQYQVTGGLAIGHAERALERHQLAEQAYFRVVSQLENMPSSEQQRPGSLYQSYYTATLDNYAASIYQQGVAQMDNGDAAGAADSFMRVVAQASASTIRVSAQRDAAALYMQTQQWQRAIDVLTDFQTRFPNNADTATIPARLLLANQSLGNWAGAATQAMVLAANDSDPTVRQEALYSAAEFYQKAGDTAQAIESYRSYAHKYAEPLEQNIESQFRLTELYAAQGAVAEREFWLQKLIQTHSGAAQPTDRSRYLAVFAASHFAENDFAVYDGIVLNHPLKTSLAKKRKAMQKALASYQAVAAYDVAEFSTQATHRIGEIYASLASDLLASERPAGLNELELEQYNFLLEEQAYPFEESAIEFYTVNIERAWKGIYSDWVKASYTALAELLPARFNKQEIRPGDAP